MFKFKKGNPENLEGKVLIYTSVICPHSEELIFPALYTSSSPLDVILFQTKQMGMPDSIAEELTKEITNQLKEEKNSNSIFKTISTPTNLDDIEDFSLIDGDVIEGAKLNNLRLVTSFLTSLSNSYMTLYLSQLESKVGIEESLNEILKKSNFKESYKNYKPDQLKEKLYSLTGLLIDSVRDKHKPRQDKLIGEIISITKDSFFYKDAINLISVAKGSDKNKIALSEMYIAKIAAIHSEDYETAEKMKKNIENIEKSQ